jgi:hypothetical protein
MTNLLITSKLDRNPLSANPRADNESGFYGLASDSFKKMRTGAGVEIKAVRKLSRHALFENQRFFTIVVTA